MGTRLSAEVRDVLEQVHPTNFSGSGDYATPESNGQFLSWLCSQRIARKLGLRGADLDDATASAVCISVAFLPEKLQEADGNVAIAIRFAVNEGVRHVLRGRPSPRPDDFQSSYPPHEDALNRRRRRGHKTGRSLARRRGESAKAWIARMARIRNGERPDERGGARQRTARPVTLADIDPADREDRFVGPDPAVRPTEQPATDYSRLEALIAELPDNLRPTARLVGYGLSASEIAKRQSITRQCVPQRIARMAEHLGHEGTTDREPTEAVLVVASALQAARRPW